MKKGDSTTQRGRIPYFPRVLGPYSYGQGPAVGPHTVEWCWPLLAGLWRAIAPLMQAWCAEGDVPTDSNPNLYRGWKSRVAWHCDDESLSGECGEAKLIVSVSFGTQTLFKWKGKSCSDSEASSCFLGHGDILVMDGQCQDEFLHCTDPGLEQERINVTFRWIRQHGYFLCLCFFDRGGMLSANVCAGFIRFCHGVRGEWWFGGALWVLLGALCMWEGYQAG